MKIASVVLKNCTRQFDKEYDYMIPDKVSDMILPGICVRVPFGRSDKPSDAYVFDVFEKEDAEDLKSLMSVIDPEPVLDANMIDLAKWMKDRYICTFKDAIKCMVPGGIGTTAKKKTIENVHLKLSREKARELIISNSIKNIKQIRTIELLIENEILPVSELLMFAGITRPMLKSLEKKELIGFKHTETFRQLNPDKIYKKTKPIKMNADQQTVFESLTDGLNKGVFNEYLIHGVTGSGKTEVYMQLIAECIAEEKQAIVLIPEISLTPQMIERFKGRFGERVAVLHSRLSPGERYDQWRMIREGRVDIAVGARSAVFAPFKRPGLVIIDEEHENTYKSENTPKYEASEIARERMKRVGGILISGSATPSITTYEKAVKGEIKLLVMGKRVNDMMPKIITADMRNELDSGNRTMFSRVLADGIRENMESGRQTILFLNKRGSASFVLCRSCGLVMKCPNCNISTTYHSFDDRLICHYCGFTEKNPTICPKCGSNYIKHFGTGTQKVEEDLKKEFPGITVLRMDADTTAGKNSHEKILDSFVKNNVNVLVGTQMIAKGLDFPNVTLVGVLAADSMLNIGDFRASEKTFQLITQVSGRSGRGEAPGKVVVQTYNTDDYSIQAALNNDYSEFYENETEIRRKLDYPPFTNIGVIIASDEDDKKAYAAAVAVKNETDESFGAKNGLKILGPARAPLSKIKKKYRWRIIIKHNDKRLLTELFRHIAESGKNGGIIGKTSLSMDINPVNML